jgi:hypothetical protein
VRGQAVAVGNHSLLEAELASTGPTVVVVAEAETRSGRKGFVVLAVGRLAVEGSLVVLVAAMEDGHSLAIGLARRRIVGCRRESRNVRWLALGARNSGDVH